MIVTSGGYTIPFHLDQYDSLIFAVKNTRVIFLIDNFEELYRESEIELFSNSYVPNSFKERAVIKKITLNEGYGIFVKRLQPHAVKTLIKDDYTIAYTHCVQEEFDILKKVEKC